MYWLDPHAVQGTLKSLLQHHSSKASILLCSAFFIVQLSHPYLTTEKTKGLTRQTFVGKVMSVLFSMLSRLVIAFLFFSFLFLFIYFYNIVVVFAIHWHESAMDLHVFPIPIPTPTSLPTPSLWVFPVHQPRALVLYIQPGLVICFTLDNIHVSMLFSQNIPPLPSPTESKNLFCTSVSFCFAYRVIVTIFLNSIYMC